MATESELPTCRVDVYTQIVVHEDSNIKIFVGNLPWSHDDELLARLFEQHGEVLEANVVVDTVTGQSRGFGFVEMPNRSEALAAIDALHHCDLEGRQLEVSPARTRERSVG